MLHPRVSGDDQVAGKPRAEKNHESGEPVPPRPEPLFAEQEESQKRGRQEKREDALHRQRLPDHSAGSAGELRPVGAELKFQGNACHHAEGKIDAEDSGPESRRAVVMLVPGAQRQSLEDNQKQREPHGELRKEIVKSNSEGEMQTVDCQSVVQDRKSTRLNSVTSLSRMPSS